MNPPKYLFIGYTQNIGKFTDDKTGEVIDYSNRICRFITNSGANKNVDGKHDVGFSQFSQKLKAADLAAILGVPCDDKKIDEALNSILQKEIIPSFAPNGDKLALCYFVVKS